MQNINASTTGWHCCVWGLASSDDTDLVTDVHWNHSKICAQLQYNAQMCKKPMHAQVSMLTRGKLSWLRLPLSWHWRVFQLHLWWSTYGGVCLETVGIRYYWPHTSRNPSFPRRAMAWQGVRIREISQDVHQNVEFVDPDDEWLEIDRHWCLLV